MKSGIKDLPHSVQSALSEFIPELSKAYLAKRIWLFGSVAKGRSREDSDIDILIETDKKISRENFRFLNRNLTARAGKRIDIVFTSEAQILFERLVIPESERILLFTL